MVRCPQCDSELLLREGRWHCPRCDFWKESYAEESWRKHAQNVSVLLAQLKRRFPQITWQTGLGALVGNHLDIPPGNKGEPDLKGWWMRRHFISIEVSGTDSPKVSVPPDDIFIGAWKLNSEVVGIAHLFYMVYRNSTYTLPISIIKTYRAHIQRILIKGKMETYVVIPYTAARPGTDLFLLIAKELHELDPRFALTEAR